MGFITVCGEPGCRHEEVARLLANRLKFQLITQSEIRSLIAEEFGAETSLPDKAYAPVVVSILARVATQHHVVVCAAGIELLLKSFPAVLRTYVVASEARRAGTLMLNHRLDRPAAKLLLQQLTEEERKDRMRKFRRRTAPRDQFDLVLSEEALDVDALASIIEAAAFAKGIPEAGLLSATAEAHLQFDVRLQLAKFGITPPGKASLKRAAFVNQSEEIFANLLDFYRIAWQYEPKSFPLQWDKNGKPIEAFTPDFYLPEYDLYIELTTMKQSLVTKKNRKVKLLRSLYPHVNIKVYYQKDFQNLIFKHGLAGAER
jgi:cytidylate kinase